MCSFTKVSEPGSKPGVRDAVSEYSYNTSNYTESSVEVYLSMEMEKLQNPKNNSWIIEFQQLIAVGLGLISTNDAE